MWVRSNALRMIDAVARSVQGRAICQVADLCMASGEAIHCQPTPNQSIDQQLAQIHDVEVEVVANMNLACQDSNTSSPQSGQPLHHGSSALDKWHHCQKPSPHRHPAPNVFKTWGPYKQRIPFWSHRWPNLQSREFMSLLVLACHCKIWNTLKVLRSLGKTVTFV